MSESTAARNLQSDCPSDAVLLDLWLDHSSADDRDPIGLRGEPVYRYFWRTWVRYLETGKSGLVASPVKWHEVTPHDIAQFLNVGPRGVKNNTDPSTITKRRYWRLLDRIYDFARKNGWIENNPAEQLLRQEKPPPEDPRGFILTPQIWGAAIGILAEPPKEGALQLRNHALNLALFELGLMPMELRSLELSSLVFREVADSQWHLCALQLDGPGAGQLRKLNVSDALSASLMAWRRARAEMRSSRASDILFASRAGKPMTSMQVNNIVRELLSHAAMRAEQPLPPRTGPQIVRNTRLVTWLNQGIAPSKVAAWAGLKDVGGLYHLRQHLHPGIDIFAKTRCD